MSMAPPVNRKAAERAKLAIFGESGITSLGGKGTILTAEAVEMHEFSSDSECSTLSSDSDTISSGPDANSVGSQDDGATQLSPDVDDTKKGYDEEAKLPDLSCSTNSQIQAFLGAPPAAAAASGSSSNSNSHCRYCIHFTYWNNWDSRRDSSSSDIW